MTPRAHRRLMLAFALAGAIVCASMLGDRRSRDWDRPPVLPYSDWIADHWLYRVFDGLASPGQHLGIWGWAAHQWVYTGLLPATRESSTEFAFLDWGPDGYYRKRYLAALRADPPEFFVEAVGPGQFLFDDRSRFGMENVPGLREFIAAGYQRLLDDGETDVHVRNDVFAACCSRPTSAWRGSGGTAVAAGTERLPAGVRDPRDWTEAQLATSDGTLRMDVDARVPVSRVLVPFVSMGSPAGARIGAITGGDGKPGNADCDATLRAAVSGQFNVCILDVEPGRQITALVVTDRVRDPEGSLVVGRPVFIHQLPQPGSSR